MKNTFTQTSYYTWSNVGDRYINTGAHIWSMYNLFPRDLTPFIFFADICCSWTSGLNEPQHDETNKMACAPSKDRSACASAQSDQRLRCPHEEALGPWLSTERTAKTDQSGWMLRLIWAFAGRTGHFVDFVMLWLKWDLNSVTHPSLYFSLEQKPYVLDLKHFTR